FTVTNQSGHEIMDESVLQRIKGYIHYEMDHGWRRRIAGCYSKPGDQPKKSHG
ncbi:hypothetical protein ACJX0J_042211, partial [Zea mays]